MTTNNKKSLNALCIQTQLNGGPEGIRTHDLSDANRTLSQLSYRPIFSAKRFLFNGEIYYSMFCCIMQALRQNF